MNIKIKKVGNTLKKIRSNINKVDKNRVDIGYFDSQGMHYSGMSYPELMDYLEFGDPDTPPRPVFRLTADDTPVEKIPKLSKSLSDIVDGNSDTSLDSIGVFYKDAIKDNFGDTSLLASNSQLTQELKGRDEPLVDTGDLRDNLTYKKRKK